MTTATLPPPDAAQKKRWLYAGAGVLSVIVLAFVARGAFQPEPPSAPVERVTPWMEDGVIHYPAGFASREKITFGTAEETELTPNLYVTGQVVLDGRRVSALGARIEGRLRALHRIEGERVEQGEIVAELESVELGRAQADVLKARAKEEVARVDADRERKLADAKVSAERDAQFAEANLKGLIAERVATERTVEALGGSMNGELGVLKLKSPIAGKVVELKRRRGETVSPTDTVMVVADLSRVWVELTVFERDVPGVRVGDEVDIKLPADKGHVFHGTVAHVSEVIDRDTRAAHVRVELENPDGRLRSGLSVTAVVHTTGPRDTRLTIPRSAVTRVDGKPTVFVSAGTDAVEPRVLKLGPEDADDVAVVEGLKVGEQVVTSGVLALKAEVFR